MTKINLILGGILLAALLAGGLSFWWLKTENDILTANAAALELANTTNQQTIDALREDAIKKQQSLKARENDRKAAVKRAKLLKLKLNQALTKDEKECYTSTVPDVVIDGVNELFNTESSTSNDD